MIINKIIVIYYFLMFTSLAVGLVGGVAGLSSLVKWGKSPTSEQRDTIEKKLYLCLSAILLGTCIRLIMLPVWFIMLQGLIPLIPGAMCLSGIHQNVPFYSWAASSMKLLLPLFYFAWIALSFVDRKLPEQPFLRLRHLFLLPLVILLLTESYLDIKFLGAIKPINVTCCTALFDMSSGATTSLLTDSHWYFVSAFAFALTLQLAMFRARPNNFIFSITGINLLALFILLPLALHTKISPLLLEAPFHHCIFCLLQNKPLVLTGTILVFMGIYIGFAYSIIGLSASYTKSIHMISISLDKLKLWSAICLVAGFSLLLLATWPLIFSSNGGL